MPLVCLVYTSVRMFTYEEIKGMGKKGVETTEETKQRRKWGREMVDQAREELA